MPQLRSHIGARTLSSPLSLVVEKFEVEEHESPSGKKSHSYHLFTRLPGGDKLYHNRVPRQEFVKIIKKSHTSGVVIPHRAGRYAKGSNEALAFGEKLFQARSAKRVARGQAPLQRRIYQSPSLSAAPKRARKPRVGAPIKREEDLYLSYV